MIRHRPPWRACRLRLGAILDPFWIRVVSTVVIAMVGLIGLRGGLDALERLTIGAVSLKLALIGALLSALAVATIVAVHGGTFSWPALAHARGTHDFRMRLGPVTRVPGFEPSTHLGPAREANTRAPPAARGRRAEARGASAG